MIQTTAMALATALDTDTVTMATATATAAATATERVMTKTVVVLVLVLGRTNYFWVDTDLKFETLDDCRAALTAIAEINNEAPFYIPYAKGKCIPMRLTEPGPLPEKRRRNR